MLERMSSDHRHPRPQRARPRRRRRPRRQRRRRGPHEPAFALAVLDRRLDLPGAARRRARGPLGRRPRRGGRGRRTPRRAAVRARRGHEPCRADPRRRHRGRLLPSRPHPRDRPRAPRREGRAGRGAGRRSTAPRRPTASSSGPTPRPSSRRRSAAWSATTRRARARSSTARPRTSCCACAACSPGERRVAFGPCAGDDLRSGVTAARAAGALARRPGGDAGALARPHRRRLPAHGPPRLGLQPARAARARAQPGPPVRRLRGHARCCSPSSRCGSTRGPSRGRWRRSPSPACAPRSRPTSPSCRRGRRRSS